jgi:hypothetical protein
VAATAAMTGSNITGGCCGRHGSSVVAVGVGCAEEVAGGADLG